MIYDYCPKCGTKYSAQEKGFTCSNCRAVTYLNSKPTASTLIVDGDKVLLGKRRSEPEKGKWDVIGGFLEYGEHPEVGAQREAKEETGLEVKIKQLLGIFMDHYGPDQYSTLNICYIVTVMGGEPKAADDIEELKWFYSDSIPEDIAFQNGKDMLNAWINQKKNRLMQDPECRFCQNLSSSQESLLEETKNFYVFSDEHPIIEGHILIIPKDHISCVGEYSQQLFEEFIGIYERVSKFVKNTYGSLSSFEHGKLGQSIFHSHVHILPFSGTQKEIIFEESKIKEVKGMHDVRKEFESKGEYLFFSIQDRSWLVDGSLAFPRFFRDKFAQALGKPERADWNAMHNNEDLMAIAQRENQSLLNKWKANSL